MILEKHFVSAGARLFRWRSFIPLILLVPTLVAMRHYTWPLGRHGLQEGWELLCLSVSFIGLAIRVLTVGFVPGATSGRNTRGQVAAQLNITGMYSVVRHPLYLGNFLMFLGVSLFPRTWWLPILYALFFMLYYERIMLAEESFLRDKCGDAFIRWADKTPAIWPRLSNWTSPALPFSMLTVLKREYSGLLGLTAAFFLLEILEHFSVQHRFVVEKGWLVFVAIVTAMYVILRGLKKHTRLIHVDGR